MPRFSPEIPWVLVQPGAAGFHVACEICKFTGVTPDYESTQDFADFHRTHAAPPGSLRLGDAFAAVAKPIAHAMGKPPCSPCEARRQALNRLRRPW